MEELSLAHFISGLSIEKFPWADVRIERLEYLCAIAENAALFEYKKTIHTSIDLSTLLDVDIVVIRKCAPKTALVVNKEVIFRGIEAPFSIPLISTKYAEVELFLEDGGEAEITMDLYMLENVLFKKYIGQTFINEKNLIFSDGIVVRNNFIWTCMNEELKNKNPEKWRKLIADFSKDLSENEKLVARYKLEDCEWKDLCIEISGLGDE